MRKIKVLSLIMAIIILITVVFSDIYLIEHTHHHCLGEDCPICLEIEMAAHIVAILRTAIPVIIVFMAFLYIFDILINKTATQNITKLTLISLKVELDD